MKPRHARERHALRLAGWALLACVFIACDPRGCGCGCGCGCGTPPTTTSSSASSAPSSCACAPILPPDASLPDAGGRDAGAMDVGAREAAVDAFVPVDACPLPLPGDPCTETTCPFGTCSIESDIRLWDPDAGVVVGQLAQPVCRIDVGLGACPCGTQLGAIALGPASTPLANGQCMRTCALGLDCPVGQTCRLGLCQPACTDDAFCQRRARDVDGDGTIEWAVDPSTAATCDLASGRCVRPGRAGARVGDACADDHDCEANGFCLFVDAAGGGVCARADCSDADCTGDLVCVATSGRPSVCVPCALLLGWGFADPRCDADAGVDDAGIDGG